MEYFEFKENEYDDSCKNEEDNDSNKIIFSKRILKTINRPKKIYKNINNEEKENEKKIMGKKRKI